MTKMYKCDRCGKVEEMHGKQYISFPYRGIYKFAKKKHICSDCEASFRHWFWSPLEDKNIDLDEDYEPVCKK